jgi:hypothetical protein
MDARRVLAQVGVAVLSWALILDHTALAIAIWFFGFGYFLWRAKRIPYALLAAPTIVIPAILVVSLSWARLSKPFLLSMGSMTGPPGVSLEEYRGCMMDSVDLVTPLDCNRATWGSSTRSACLYYKPLAAAHNRAVRRMVSDDAIRRCHSTRRTKNADEGGGPL